MAINTSLRFWLVTRLPLFVAAVVLFVLGEWIPGLVVLAIAVASVVIARARLRRQGTVGRA